MPRIFATLASLSLGLYAAALVLGLGIGDLYESPEDQIESIVAWKGTHLLTGAAAALAVVFVHSIVVTYFIGTNRWVKEVSETYRFEGRELAQSTLLKRKTFPWCLMGMLAVVTVGALGAASDPGTGRSGTESVAIFHLFAALSGLAFVGYTYYRAWNNIMAHQAVIEGILSRVAEVRAEKGLETAEPIPGAIPVERAAAL